MAVGGRSWMISLVLIALVVGLGWTSVQQNQILTSQREALKRFDEEYSQLQLRLNTLEVALKSKNLALINDSLYWFADVSLSELSEGSNATFNEITFNLDEILLRFRECVTFEITFPDGERRPLGECPTREPENPAFVGHVGWMAGFGPAESEGRIRIFTAVSAPAVLITRPSPFVSEHDAVTAFICQEFYGRFDYERYRPASAAFFFIEGSRAYFADPRDGKIDRSNYYEGSLPNGLGGEIPASAEGYVWVVSLVPKCGLAEPCPPNRQYWLNATSGLLYK